MFESGTKKKRSYSSTTDKSIHTFNGNFLRLTINVVGKEETTLSVTDRLGFFPLKGLANKINH